MKKDIPFDLFFQEPPPKGSPEIPQARTPIAWSPHSSTLSSAMAWVLPVLTEESLDQIAAHKSPGMK